MPKLKTYGVITEEEVKQAELDGTFLIADTVSCKYCDQPVRVDTDPDYFYCPHHYKLALSMHWYPGYPAVPMDAPRYKQMHFYVSPLERNRPRFVFFPEDREYFATKKGCPFCQRYMTPGDRNIENHPDASLLNQRMFCPDCGVSFRIEVIDVIGVPQIRFTPDVKFLRNTEQTQNNVEQVDIEQTQNNVEQTPDETTPAPEKNAVPRHSLSLPVREKPVDVVGDGDFSDILPKSVEMESEPVPTEPEPEPEPENDAPPKNAHTDIAGQIEAFLSNAENYTARTREMIAAIGCVPEGFNKGRKKLLKEGRIREVKRGVYHLIHHT